MCFFYPVVLNHLLTIRKNSYSIEQYNIFLREIKHKDGPMDYWQLMSSDEQGDSIDAYWARIQKEGNQESDQAPPLTQRCMPDSTVLKSKGIEVGWSMGLAQLFRKYYYEIDRKGRYGETITTKVVNKAIKDLVGKSTSDKAGLMVIDKEEMDSLIDQLGEHLRGIDAKDLSSCLDNLTGLSTRVRTEKLMDLHESTSSYSLTRDTFVLWFFAKCYENVTYSSKLRMLDAFYTANKDIDVEWHVFLSHFITKVNVSQIEYAEYTNLSTDFILEWLNGTDDLFKLCLTSLCANSKIDLLQNYYPYIKSKQKMFLKGIESEYVDHMVKNGISKINFDLPLGTTLSITNDNVKQYIDFMAIDTDQKGGIGVTSVSMAKIMNDIIAFTKRSGTADNKSHLLRIIENNPNLLELFFTVDATRSYLHILEDLAGCIGYPHSADVSIDLSSYRKIYFTYLLIKAQVHLDNDTVAITSSEYGYLNTHVRSLNAVNEIHSGTPDAINQAISNKQWSALSNLAYEQLTQNNSVSSCAEGIAFKNFKEVEPSQPNISNVVDNMIRQVGSIVQVVIAEMHSKRATEDEIAAIESAMRQLKHSIQPEQVQLQCNELSSLIENTLWLQQGLLSKIFELLRRIIVYFNPSLRSRMFFADPSYVRCPKQLKDIGRLSPPQNSASGGG